MTDNGDCSSPTAAQTRSQPADDGVRGVVFLKSLDLYQGLGIEVPCKAESGEPGA